MLHYYVDEFPERIKDGEDFEFHKKRIKRYLWERKYQIVSSKNKENKKK